MIQQRLGIDLITQQQHHATPLSSYPAHGLLQAPAARLGHQEQVAQRVDIVYPHQRRLLGLDIAQGQRHVNHIIGAIAVGHQVELTQLAAQQFFFGTLNRALVEQAVVNQVGNGADLDVVLLGELFQLRATGHAAIVVHDLADHRRLAKAGHTGQVTGGFGVAGTRQHATGLGHQREDVARTDDVLGHGIGSRGSLHSACTVSGGNAGADANRRLDGHGELGTKTRAVALHHQRQLQALAALQAHRHADQATAVARHEVDVLSLTGLGGHDQIAFVLAVFVIHQDDHLAGANIFDQFFDAVEFHPALRGQVNQDLRKPFSARKAMLMPPAVGSAAFSPSSRRSR